MLALLCALSALRQREVLGKGRLGVWRLGHWDKGLRIYGEGLRGLRV